MTPKKTSFFLIIIGILFSACGPEPEPTMSAADVQGTAAAAAWTMVAETQMAIPTDTPIPPTETAAPTVIATNTIQPLELPTQAFASPTTASSTDDCNKVLPAERPGRKALIKLINETKAPANVSLYLEMTPHGVCGYQGFQVPKFGSTGPFEFPQGVMYGYAWILEPVNTTVSGGPWKPNNNDKWEIYIDEYKMKMVGP
jgi:hypothetical protein